MAEFSSAGGGGGISARPASMMLSNTDIQYLRSGGATHTWSNGNDLFEKCADGLILCKLINLASIDTIDERALNIKEGMNVYQQNENVNLALNAAKAIGCQVVNIGSSDIISGRPILILGLVWQIIRIQLLSQISLKNVPELVVLLADGEDLASFIKLPPETILLRWMNYHLARGGYPNQVHNFGGDIANSAAYGVLMTQLMPSVCRPITQTEAPARAAQVITNARGMGVNTFIAPKDICDGNRKLNIAFVAQIFNQCHGLSLTEEEKVEFDMSSLEIDDAGDTREERVLRMWINSLNIDEVYVQDLFADLDDGLVILKLAEKIVPGCVDWRRATRDPKTKFKKVENANYACGVCKSELKFSMVNIGGVDIAGGNKKLILSVIAQMMRKYTLKVLAGLASSTGAAEMTDEQIVAWANDKVASTGKRTRIRSFRDKHLANSLFFLELIEGVQAGAIDWSIVTRGDTPEDQLLNAKYAISAARKVGATVFLTPEDIVEVKGKMLVIFASGIWEAELQ